MSAARRFSLLVALFLLVSGSVTARAQVYKGVELVKADLLADTTAVAPGKPFTVGLRLKMAPHWHTYWQYSGEAGLPTKIEWQLPEGFKAGPFQWPVPDKIVSPGDIINFGYSDEVVLLTEITPPAQIPAGEITLKGKADWLVCEATCVPGDAAVSLKLATGGTPAPANAEILDKHRTRLPLPYDEEAAGFHLTRQASGTNIVLTANTAAIKDFYPLPTGDADTGHVKVEHPSAQETRITIPVTTGAADLNKVGGVLAVATVEGQPIRTVGWTIPAGPDPAASPTAGTVEDVTTASATGGNPPPAAGSSTGFAGSSPAKPAGSLFYFLLLGLVGGLILNVMPCVLPVISLKLFSLVKQSGDTPERILRLGLAYAAGVFTWFLGFATLVVALRSAGHRVGYAVHLQSPWFLVALSAATFVFALNLLGVFEIILPGAVTNAAGAASAGCQGYAGSYLQGLLATVLGSACTAPIFGAALGFAFSQNGPVIFAMFTAIAAGMSAPFLLIAANPRWLRFLPKPGEWMERVKQGTGFLLLATVLWLLWTLGHVRGSDAVIWTGALLLVLGAACWVQGAFNTLVSSDRSRWLSRGAIAALVIGGGWYALAQVDNSQPPDAADRGPFGPKLAAALKTGRPVFVDFTADWCVSCHVNEKVVLSSDAVQKALRDRNTVFLKADYTARSEDISKLLEQFNAASVPLYVLYPAGKPDAPIRMPELITQQIVLDAFTEADKRAKGAAGASVASR